MCNNNYKKNLDALSKSPLFKNLDIEILKKMIKYFTLKKFNKGDFINCYDSYKDFFIIVSGRLRVDKIDPNSGKYITLYVLSNGDAFDVLPLLDNKEHEVEAVSIDNSEILQVPIDIVRDWIAQYPQFNKEFLPYIINYLREVEEFSAHISFHDTATRLAKLILKHTVEESNYEHNTIRLIHDFTHDALSKMIATSRSVLSTKLQELKHDGIISTKKGSLVVKDFKKLVEKAKK